MSLFIAIAVCLTSNWWLSFYWYTAYHIHQYCTPHSRGRLFPQVGDDLEIYGMRKDPLKTTCTGVEMFKKTLDQGQAGAWQKE